MYIAGMTTTKNYPTDDGPPYADQVAAARARSAKLQRAMAAVDLQRVRIYDRVAQAVQDQQLDMTTAAPLTAIGALFNEQLATTQFGRDGIWHAALYDEWEALRRAWYGLSARPAGPCEVCRGPHATWECCGTCSFDDHICPVCGSWLGHSLVGICLDENAMRAPAGGSHV